MITAILLLCWSLLILMAVALESATTGVPRYRTFGLLALGSAVAAVAGIAGKLP